MIDFPLCGHTEFGSCLGLVSVRAFVLVARFVESVSGLLRASIAVCVAARGDSVLRDYVNQPTNRSFVKSRARGTRRNSTRHTCGPRTRTRRSCQPNRSCGNGDSTGRSPACGSGGRGTMWFEFGWALRRTVVDRPGRPGQCQPINQCCASDRCCDSCILRRRERGAGCPRCRFIDRTTMREWVFGRWQRCDCGRRVDSTLYFTTMRCCGTCRCYALPSRRRERGGRRRRRGVAAGSGGDARPVRGSSPVGIATSLQCSRRRGGRCCACRCCPRCSGGRSVAPDIAGH